MSQSTLPLVLLLWTTILSICQVVFIILFFTAQHRDLSQNSSAVGPEHKLKFQKPDALLHPTEDSLTFKKSQMLSYEAKEWHSGVIKWSSRYQKSELLIKEEKEKDFLLIMRDGYCFLNLQVTLCKQTQELEKCERNVSLKSDEEVLLKGWINTKTNSTGLLGGVHGLIAGKKLEVHIHPPPSCIETNGFVTHLDIIWMENS